MRSQTGFAGLQPQRPRPLAGRGSAQTGLVRVESDRQAFLAARERQI